MPDNYSTYNSLMKHIRSKGIDINGSSQKKVLMNVGYYHGYKGYRYKGNASHKLPFENFAQIKAVNDFDEALKSLLYTPLMRLETAVKSHACDVIVTKIKSSDFSDIFERGMISSSSSKKDVYKARDSIYSNLTKRYDKSCIVKHFYNMDRPVPMWAIFEEMMLGELSNLIKVLDDDIKLTISKRLGIPQGMNTNGALLPKVLLSVKDLRNAIAHNKVIYDGRYIEFDKSRTLKKMLMDETGISNIKSDTLLDDIILICFLLKNLEFPLKEIKFVIKGVKNALKDLKNKLPNMLYQDVVSGFPITKINEIQEYLNK